LEELRQQLSFSIKTADDISAEILAQTTYKIEQGLSTFAADLESLGNRCASGIEEAKTANRLACQ